MCSKPHVHVPTTTSNPKQCSWGLHCNNCFDCFLQTFCHNKLSSHKMVWCINKPAQSFGLQIKNIPWYNSALNMWTFMNYKCMFCLQSLISAKRAWLRNTSCLFSWTCWLHNQCKKYQCIRTHQSSQLTWGTTIQPQPRACRRHADESIHRPTHEGILQHKTASTEAGSISNWK